MTKEDLKMFVGLIGLIIIFIICSINSPKNDKTIRYKAEQYLPNDSVKTIDTKIVIKIEYECVNIDDVYISIPYTTKEKK